MIKLINVVLLVLLLMPKMKAQIFEGLIVYSNSYHSKSKTFSSEQLNSLMGNQQAYAIKDRNYKSVFNGTFIKLQIYRGDENRCYNLTAKSDTLYWQDYWENNDEAVSYEIIKNQDTILGIPCDMIIVKAKKSITYFYYNAEYSIYPELFENHNYGNWYYIVSKTKSLPIKTIFENDQFIMTSIATEITLMKLEDNVFEIQNKSKVTRANW